MAPRPRRWQGGGGGLKGESLGLAAWLAPEAEPSTRGQVWGTSRLQPPRSGTEAAYISNQRRPRIHLQLFGFPKKMYFWISVFLDFWLNLDNAQIGDRGSLHLQPTEATHPSPSFHREPSPIHLLSPHATLLERHRDLDWELLEAWLEPVKSVHWDRESLAIVS